MSDRSPLPPAHPVETWNHLCAFLNGAPDSFTGHLLALIAKADPGNRERLRGAFPRQVAAWEIWCGQAPDLTAGALEAALAAKMAATPPPGALNARYGTDPDALAWARGHVQALRDKCRSFESAAMADEAPERASQWKRMANLLQMKLIGGTGCVITPFDERRATLPGMEEISW